jgi:hypothetical protein
VYWLWGSTASRGEPPRTDSLLELWNGDPAMRISLENACALYGGIVDGVWTRERDWCVFVPIPEGISLINRATGKLMTRIYCNKDMAAPLEAALHAVVAGGLAHELRYFDGCLMVRDVRGQPGKLSTHAYALAIDFNALEMPLGSGARFSKAFVACFMKHGFAYGGDFRRRDGMHFSFAWE